MRSLPSIFKYYEAEGHVEDYVFVPQLESFEEIEEEEDNQGADEQDEENLDAEEDESFEDLDEDEQEAEKAKEEQKRRRMTEKEAEEIIAEANRQAKEILDEAKEEAEQLKKEAYTTGFDQGHQEGYEAAYEEQQALLLEESSQFLTELENILNDLEQRKSELLQKHRKDMKNISIAVAEKVIQISLKTSGGVIERMIESATEKLKRKEWMKVYIAKCDADMLLEGDTQLMRNLSHISKHVKLIVMENETPGTCIIELPDEIIDASAQTQVENIKEILNNASI